MEEKKEPKTLTDKMDKVYEFVNTMDSSKDKKKSKSRLFRKLKISLRKQQKNYVSIIVLYPNGNAAIEKLPITDNCIKLKSGTYHVSSSEYVWNLGKLPFIIQPSWDMKPISKGRLNDITSKTGAWVDPQKVLIHFMELSQVKPKSAFGGKNLLIWVIVGIVVLYLLNSVLTGGA